MIFLCNFLLYSIYKLYDIISDKEVSNGFTTAQKVNS